VGLKRGVLEVKLCCFRADAHPSGGRIDVSWEVYPESGEILKEAGPIVWVKRKKRDFMFPSEIADRIFLIYHGQTFRGKRQDGIYTEREEDYRVEEVVDVTKKVDVSTKKDIIIKRRWIRTYFDLNGNVHHLQVRIADYGDGDKGLLPGQYYYYQIFSNILPEDENPWSYRAVAQATGRFDMATILFKNVPAIHQRQDKRRPDEEGQLQRFLSIFGDQLDLMRSLTKGLLGVHDVDNCDYRYLPLMAQWIGWDLNFAASIPIRRHEIKYAAALYRITGTIPGCMIWVKRLTGWEARIKEFYRNVFISNDLGNPDDPTDHGSLTVDTTDSELLANIHTFDDNLDYTYDTGTTDDDWYALNAVGFFVRPDEDEVMTTVLDKKTNLVRNLPLFMPVNIRGVVIFETFRSDDSFKSFKVTLDLLKETTIVHRDTKR
jgi:phage tail-like protein